MDPEAIPNFLAEQRDIVPDEAQAHFLTFEDYWERKLWHQLTEELSLFFSLDHSSRHRLPLFQSFISTFGEKINQLKFVKLGLRAAEELQNDDERIVFLSKIAERVDKPASQDAFVFAKVAVAKVKLRKQNFEDAKKDLAQCEAILDSFDAVETSVHAAFYEVNSDYFQAKHEFASYYRNALLYLACIDVQRDLAPDETQRRAYDLSIAALVSDTIYNFGELLLHPILDSLRDSPHAWLRDLLFAFNAGDLGAYNVLAGHMSKNELLSEHKQFLYQKISLAALTEAVFRRPPHDRSMNFSTIRDETKVEPNDIELLIMKALSLGLLRGTIDQVAQMANINWVQPKVLDLKQIENMRSRLREWDASVNQLGTFVEGVGKDVWAA